MNFYRLSFHYRESHMTRSHLERGDVRAFLVLGMLVIATPETSRGRREKCYGCCCNSTAGFTQAL